MPQNSVKLHTPFLKGGPSTTQKRGGLRWLRPHSPHPISTTDRQLPRKHRLLANIGKTLVAILSRCWRPTEAIRHMHHCAALAKLWAFFLWPMLKLALVRSWHAALDDIMPRMF